MSISATCPHCGKHYSLDPSLAGKKARCKECKNVFQIPPAASTPAASGAPAASPSASRQRPRPQPAEVSAGGVPIYRHDPKPMENEDGDGTGAAVTPYAEQIERHLEQHVGPIGRVFHELISEGLHLDLLIIPPTNQEPSEEHPLGTSHYTICTCGLSARAQNVPEEAIADGISPRQELLIALPADWPGLRPDGTWDDAAMADESNWWPMLWLKRIARMPFEYDTFLAHSVTIPNGEDADPFAPDTKLGCMMVFPSVLAPNVAELEIDGGEKIQFWSLWPLYPEEMQMKLDGKFEKLLERFMKAEQTELIDPKRTNHGKKKGWFGR